MARYELDGKPIPSVTEILAEILGVGWQAGEFYLQRGRAVHACAALIAQGKDFDFDPQIAGQVQACRKFFEVFKPEVIAVEAPMISELYQFAGTADLIARINGKKCVVDYKASIPKTAILQLAGYAELFDLKWGMPVVLGENGNFRPGKIVDLKIPRRKFLALLTTYNVKRELGLLKGEAEHE